MVKIMVKKVACIAALYALLLTSHTTHTMSARQMDPNRMYTRTIVEDPDMSPLDKMKALINFKLLPNEGSPEYITIVGGWRDGIKAVMKQGINWDTPVDENGTTLFDELVASPTSGKALSIFESIRNEVGPTYFDALLSHANNNGETPLQRAAVTNRPVFKWLSRYPAFRNTLNNQTVNGETALHKAAAAGEIESILVLLENGADPALQTTQSATTEAGFTAYDMAAHNKKYVAAATIAQWCLKPRNNKTGFANAYTLPMRK